MLNSDIYFILFFFLRDVSHARGEHPLNVNVVFCVLKGLPADTDLITPVVPRGKWHPRCSYTHKPGTTRSGKQSKVVSFSFQR